MKTFWLCLQFFTRLPTPQYDQVSAKEMGVALAWFPVVGALIGGILVGVAKSLSFLPDFLDAILVLIIWVWITGALHLDGLADTADGWLGGVGDPQKALTIMQDSRIGTGGGVAIGLALILKWSLLIEIIHLQAWLFLFVTPILARIASLIYIKTTKYVSKAGIGEKMFAYLSLKWVIVWGSVAVLIALWLSPWLFGIVFFAIWVRWISKRITHGMTGDTAGLMTEVIEMSILLMAVISLSLNF